MPPPNNHRNFREQLHKTGVLSGTADPKAGKLLFQRVPGGRQARWLFALPGTPVSSQPHQPQLPVVAASSSSQTEAEVAIEVVADPDSDPPLPKPEAGAAADAAAV